MSKTAVLSVDIASMLKPINFKKHILLFDKIFIDQHSLWISKSLAENEGYHPDSIAVYKRNWDELYRLESLGLLEIAKLIPLTEPLIDSGELYPVTGPKQSPYVFKFIREQVARAKLLATRLREGNIEAYPLYQATQKREYQDNKNHAIQFIFSKMPEPDENVPWEQILEFRSDEDTLKKYYAMVKWINEVSKRNLGLNEIEDEYSYLYYDYLSQYKIHKIKRNFGLLEIIVSACLDSIAGAISSPSLSTTLFNALRFNINLLEEQNKFPGREIAYIYKAEEIFA